MRQRLIKVGPHADADIRFLGSRIAAFGIPLTAERYVERLYAFVMRLDIATERGTALTDIHPDLRLIPFEKSATIAVLVGEDAATVVRVFYGGEDWEGSLRRQFAGR
jgi:plasmid stabilization system protein ParE